MSLQMAATRAVLRSVYKPQGARAPLAYIKRNSQPDPPSSIAEGHEVVVEERGGVRCVWLDRARHDAGTVVYLHGGSYLMGPVREHWKWLGALTDEAGMAALMVDYTMAPEATFPVALEQALAVIGTLEGPWLLAGDSAGGGMALATAFRLREAGRALPAGLLLVSPWLDVTMSNESARANRAIDPMLSLRGLSRGAVAYAGPSNPRDPHISPIFGDPAGLPPSQIEVGTRELFLWDVRQWADRCREAGTECQVVETEGGFHDFAMAVGTVPEADQALERQAAFVRERLAV